MGSRYRRRAVVAAFVLAMSASLALAVLSPLLWKTGLEPGPAPEALPATGQVAEVVASPSAPQPQPEAREERLALVGTSAGTAASSPQTPADLPDARSVDRPSGEEKQKEQKEQKEPEPEPLVSEDSDDAVNHAQGAPGKGHGLAKGHGKAKGGGKPKADGGAKADGKSKAHGKGNGPGQGKGHGKAHGKGKAGGEDRARAPARPRS